MEQSLIICLFIIIEDKTIKHYLIKHEIYKTLFAQKRFNIDNARYKRYKRCNSHEVVRTKRHQKCQ